MVGWPVSGVPDNIELQLLLPARQLVALEGMAARAHQTVPVVLQRMIDDFLQSAPNHGFEPEVAGRPSAPRLGSEGTR
ncbi:hypothetical protein J8F10_21140 [Gemmata sp. G18]|uniref:CopG-like ribbon-helix-helix domain-containing protein n=1 Tax=Gemmata palustris TaxID=2822762 RepID=A0ABS5BVS5_9BACT|nr:hypothetical protein [Gemmata palustris]MBP3957765.1 hypothetical protein [Gemmata palustris]